MRTFFSIFNDVIGPVMSGPSSSHSAGCARIGKMTQILYGEEITCADIIFEEKGSYPNTYIGQGSNFGFTGGLLGFDTDDERLKDSVEIAKNKGIKINFKTANLGNHHPNEAQINIYDKNNSLNMSVKTFSTGGGSFEIVEMDDFPIFINGRQKMIFLALRKGYDKNKIDKLSIVNRIEHKIIKNNKTSDELYVIDNSKSNIDYQEFKQILENSIMLKDILFLRYCVPILPVNIEKEPPFFNVNEAIEYAQKHEINTLWELAIEYESKIGNIDKGMIFKLGEKVYNIMQMSMIAPEPSNTKKFGFSEYQSKNMQTNAKKKKLLNMGILNTAMFSAISVMENSCAHNRVVAAPTAGSSGVIPAAIISVGKEMGCREEDIIKGILASGLIGVFIANQATFGAEVAGCQAENGAASAMAAGGLIQLMGGTIKNGFDASGLALQNLLGLICDPLGGLTEIPCISRNVSAVANAVISANMILCGYNPCIPLDEVIQSMLEVGNLMPSQLKCTCNGGLCTTKTGKEIDRIVKKRFCTFS